MTTRTPHLERQHPVTVSDGPVDLDELQRLAFNQTFATHGFDWYWDRETFASLSRVGNVKRQLDEYGFRTGDLLTYDQLVELHTDVSRRLGELVLDLRTEQADRAWVA